MRLKDIFSTNEDKRIRELKQQQKEIEQMESHSKDDIVRYFNNIIALDLFNDKENPADRFNRFTKDYLPMVTASVINAPRNIFKQAYKTVATQHKNLYTRGIEDASDDQLRSSLANDPFMFDVAAIKQYQGKH